LLHGFLIALKIWYAYNPYKKMLIKRIIFFASLLLVFSINQLKAQEQSAAFSADTSKFIEELTVQFRSVGDADEADAKLVLSAFTYQWTSNLLLDAQKKQARSVCFTLNEHKLQIAPYYVLYFKILTSLVKQSSTAGTFDLFHKSVNYCLESKTPSRTLLKYLSQTELLVRSNAFMLTNTESWFVRNGTYKFAFDSVPSFVFSAGSLACIVRNDSACIYDTKGIFYPLTQTWKGNGGKVYWDRAKLGRDVVYAKLAGYTIDTRTISYSADSVMFYHGGYFKKFLQGKLEDKAMVDITAENATYPKFSMYKGTQVYINLFKDIEFAGGFSLQGSKVIGTPSADGYSRIEIKHNNKPFITLKSTEFAIRPDKFVSIRASVLIFIENDSIFHPSIRVQYSLANNELMMSRGEEGLGQSPFFDTFHRLDIYSGAIYWKLDQDIMSFEDMKGMRNKSEALFESSDYFSAYRFDKMQGIDDINPAMLVSAYVRRRNTDRFYADDYALWAKKPVEQIKVQLIKLANAGFLYYEIDNNFAIVQPRLNEYLAARSGVKDSDIIQFQSIVDKGANAELDLKNMRLSIEGVKRVMLSDSQYVYIVPRDGKVIVTKNRDFTFKGRVHAGLFDLMANECTFQYDKFSMSIPQIDSALMVVPAWETDANGYRPFVRVKNALANMNGELYIDAPDSKSGRKMLHNYPVLISKDTGYVYFERRDIVNGVYKKKDFYFMINPFSLDSINSLPPGDLQFGGKLVSAGIFPDLDETIRVQKDYSLGFKSVIHEPGLPVYEDRGTFSDTLSLNNSGLRGSGRLTYLSSVTESDDFLFTPDSTSAKVKNYQLARVEGQFESPDAQVKNAVVKWIPGKDVMLVNNSKDDSIHLFNNRARLNGQLTVSPTGLKGKGQISFENAELNSKTYNFKTESFTSDTSDFKLLTDDREKVALQVHVNSASIDFSNRNGHFVGSDKGAKLELPAISYNCVVNEFDWLMDKKQLLLNNHTSFSSEKYFLMKPEQLMTFDPGKEVYTSTDPKQDSISFFALRSLYDLTTNLLEVEGARIIKVADAAIFPFNGKLSIGKDGRITELRQAEILANRTSLYHRFYNATVNIGSRKRYTAKGLYDYIPSDGDITTLEMNNIAVNSTGSTFAGADISESMNFMLNKYFRFVGKMEVNASSKLIYFEGGFGVVHDCQALQFEWIKLHAQLDPKNIVIPITDVPENTGSGKLRTSIYYSTTENTVKPGFFIKAENVSDPDILKAGGYITFFPKTAEYAVADSAKLKNQGLDGNQLSLNTSRCILSGVGQLQIATNLGRLQMKSAGEINYFSVVDSTSLNVLSALDFFFPEDALKILADAINGSSSKGIDVSGTNYTRSLREFAGKNEADKILNELNLYGQYRKFPDVLDHTIVLNGLQMSWNKDMRSFISNGPIGISNIGKLPVNKQLNGYVEIGKRRSGDIINIYFEPDPTQWYFFAYANGTMQVISSNKNFNEKLSGLKEDQRRIKGEKGLPGYQFILGTNDKKATFIRKMKQAAGGE
jgi:hypothetical protein